MSSWSEEQEFPLDLSCRGADTEVSLLKGQKKLPCGICGKNFDRPSLLKRHLRTHTGEKPHGCSVCGKMFSTSSSLNTHARIHTGERPHQCPICGKRFTASSNLYYHRMTHYKFVDKCDCFFKRKRKLQSRTLHEEAKIDRRTSSQRRLCARQTKRMRKQREKPHKCNDCGRSFPTPGDLRAHSYSHTGDWPLRCPICSRGFCKTGALHHHVQLHNGNRPYHCKTCPNKFSVASNLRAHEKTHAKDRNNSGLSELATYQERKSLDVINTPERSQQGLGGQSAFYLPTLRYPWSPWPSQGS